MINRGQKRPRTNDVLDIEEPKSKKSVVKCVKNYVLRALGFSGRNQTSPPLVENPKIEQNNNHIVPEKNVVTAKQLHDYYLSLKNENSSLFNDLADAKTSTRGNPELDSFIMDNKAAESTMIKEVEIDNNNRIDKSENTENSPKIIKPASDDNTTIYNSSLLPDPLERANLIQLKKLMELERYRKLRMNYLRKHTRHLDRSGIARIAKDLKNKKKNVIVKNINDIPIKRRNTSGVFGISLLDNLDDGHEDFEAEDKKSDNVNAGSFAKPTFSSKSDLDDLDTFNKRKPVVPEKIEKPAAVKAESTATLSFKPNDKSEPSNEIKDESKKPVGFSFGASTTFSKPNPEIATADEKSKPSSGFSFGASAPSLVIPKGSDSAPLFGTKRKVAIEEIEDDNKPSHESFKPNVKSAPLFSFGKKEDDAKPAFSFGKNKEEAKPAFAFDAHKEQSEKFKPEPETEKKPATPAFSFGQAADKKEAKPGSTFSFTKPIEGKEDSALAPKFSFGKPSDGAKEDTKETTPAFSFGKPLEKKEDTAKSSSGFNFSPGATSDKKEASSFSFDQTTEKKKNEDNDQKQPTKPAFSFGQSIDKKEAKEENKPIFSFGKAAQDNDTKATSAPLFGSGQTVENKDKKNATPLFSFSKPSESSAEPATTPSFSFGQPAEKKEEKLPTSSSSFTFGKPAVSDSNKSAADIGEMKPFKFEKAGEPPAFAKMGINTNTANTTEVKNASATGFSFGSTENKPAAIGEPAKAFSFTPSNTSFGTSTSKPGNSSGNTANNTEAKPASSFNFGGISKSSEEKKETPSFAFNQTSSSNANNAPASGFSFGNNAVAASTSTGFSFGNNNMNNGSSSFSQNNNKQSSNGFGQPAAAANTGFSFGSGPASNTNSNTVTQNPGFNFGSTNNNNNNQAGNMISMNNNGFPTHPGMNSGFAMNNSNSQGVNSGFGGNNSNGFNMNNSGSQGGFNMNNGGFGGSFNNGPPNINFTGGQTQLDPSSIFQANTSGQSATPPSGLGRRKIAQLRGRRN